MKDKMQRLTALLLALMMIFGMLAASAESFDPGSMSLDSWLEMVDNAMHKLFDIHEGGSGKTIIPAKEELPSNPNKPYQNSNGYYLSQGQVSMGTSDIVTLTSSAAGQWQIQVGTMWVNLTGETGTTLTVTYAMLANTNSVNYAVRQVDADGGIIGMVTFDVTESAPAVQAATMNLTTQTRDADDGILTLEEAGDTEGKTNFNITIEYVFAKDETPAAEGYTASIAQGSDFSTTVTIPTVVGYKAKVAESNWITNGTVTYNDNAGTLTFNVTSIQKDIALKVKYEPDYVNYTVKHNKQNITDDNYTLEETETRTGLTEDTVPEVAHVYTVNGSTVYADGYKENYKGFYSLLYEKPAIAADGSTEIEVYYDRYYYLMNFDMDGGYGTDPVYARYGAEIGTVAEPTRAGYIFLGWALTKGETDVSKAVTLPTTMPAEHKTYYAIWQVEDTAKVTVVFWGENADDEAYSYLSEYTREINLKPGSEFTYSESGMLTCGKEKHTHTDDCYEFICTEEAHEHNNNCYYEEGGCQTAEHKHSVGCYPGASSEIPDGASAPWDAPSNPQNGQVLIETHILLTRKYIYVNGSWYTYSGSESSKSIVSPDCGMTEHTHTTTCIGCGMTEHEHTRANCYKLTCKEVEHTHTSSCYQQGAGLDSTLWVFKKSDTITVAADGSSVVNVYYDRVEYSVQFYNNQSCSTSGGGGYGGSSNKEYTELKITAKWGQNILKDWPEYNDSSSWYVKDKSNTWQNSIQVMPVGGAKFWGPKSGNSSYIATYYVEILDGESYDVKGSDGRYYKVHHTDTSNSSGNVTDEERYGIDGFTINNSISTSNGSSYGESKFYYTRNSYKLTFNDSRDDVKTETVKFEAPLSTYKDYVPEPPKVDGKPLYEEGSVEFGGWYQNPQCTGEEFKLDEHSMPSHDIILYAKWVPVERKVRFYLTEARYEADKDDTYLPESGKYPTKENASEHQGTYYDAETKYIMVPHGGNIAEFYVNANLTKEAMNEAKPNGAYTFVMWYYYNDAGEKIPFDPTTQVRRDLTLFGEWSSNTLKKYTVRYVLAEKAGDVYVVKLDEDSNPIKVADDLTGSGLAGTTKTFDAKGDTELYADYREGFFPTVQSQSLLLDIEKSEAELVVTFLYVESEPVPYTVHYVTAEKPDDGKTYAEITYEGKTYYKLLEDKEVENNRKAVVTENFVPISGYMPDAYQKRLVVAVDGDNVLYFFYTKDETHAYYKITHYIQDTNGKTWTEYAFSQAVGEIGTCYTASPMTIPGFEFDHIKYMAGGIEVTDTTSEGVELTEEGLEINLYYVRKKYPYKVRYLEQGTNNVLAADKIVKNSLYGKTVYESAIDIDGYDKVDPTDKSITIQIDENDPQKNVIIFYYKEKEVTISYEVVGPEGCGSVSLASETVKIMNGKAQGSTATANTNFRFVGWFTDEACTDEVNSDWVEDSTIVPQKEKGDKQIDVYKEATYYAKFEVDKAKLTIRKSGMEAGESAIFNVSGPGYDGQVVVPNGGEVTLFVTCGEYTITEVGAWSNRYTATATGLTDGKVTVTADGAEVSFTNTKQTDKWLHDETGVINNFGTDEKTDINK